MNNFVYDGFNKYKPFDKLNGKELIEEYSRAEEFYLSHREPNENWWIKPRGDDPRGFCNLRFKLKNMHQNWKRIGGFKFHDWILTDKPTSEEYITDEINNEIKNKSHGKVIDSSKFYRYFEIPYEIIDSKITTTNLIYPNSNWKLSSKHSTDYKIQKMFVEEVESSVEGWTLDNFIPIFHKYDKKFNEVYYTGNRTLESTNMFFDCENFDDVKKTLKWRYKFHIEQYLTTKLIGLFYPNLYNKIFDKEIPIMYLTGGHRLLCCILAKINPCFWTIEDAFSKKNKLLCLPFYFDGKAMILEMNFIDKNIKFYLSDKESMRASMWRNWEFLGERNYV